MFDSLPAKELILRPREVVVWLAHLRPAAAEYDHLSQLLTPDEQRKAERFYFAPDRIRYCTGRGILRLLLGAYLAQSAAELQFNYNGFGKPALAGTNLRFNLSHTGDWAVFAFTRAGEIGVDLERIDPAVETAELAQRFFSEREREQILRAPAAEQQRLFFQCWTRKEAFLKAQGAGLQLPLDQFQVSLPPASPAIAHIAWAPTEAAAWWMHAFEPAPDLIAAVTTRNQIEHFSLRHWDR